MRGKPDAEPGERLSGGNLNEVVRIADTVRRPSGPWTPTVHALLDHLRGEGFTAAPSALGVDDKGREVLSFIEGTVPAYPMPAGVFDEATLVAVACLLRRYHAAAATFVPPADAVWQLPVHQPVEVVCHNDFAPYNLVWAGGGPVGIIDFDTASPGPCIWDAAYTAYRFVPLVDPANPDVPPFEVAEQLRRLRTFCSAYDDPGITPAAVVTTAVARLDELAAHIVTSAAAGDPAWVAMLGRGDADLYRRDAAWLRAHQRELVGIAQA